MSARFVVIKTYELKIQVLDDKLQIYQVMTFRDSSETNLGQKFPPKFIWNIGNFVEGQCAREFKKPLSQLYVREITYCIIIRVQILYGIFSVEVNFKDVINWSIGRTGKSKVCVSYRISDYIKLCFWKVDD